MQPTLQTEFGESGGLDSLLTPPERGQHARESRQLALETLGNDRAPPNGKLRPRLEYAHTSLSEIMEQVANGRSHCATSGRKRQ